ncbi:Rv3235 family protein [Actinomycetospora straminea]|nr:Rv3235 family protein [Actinomycetospora straminea]MDD7935531.1 Rv3235 family protein [Actinomycetospora straminea]
MRSPDTVCTAPRRARRVGEVPTPQVRPLAEVLAGAPPAPRVAPDPDARTRRAQDELDRLAAALRPVAARLLTAVGDVLAGRRPATHLEALLAPEALAALARAAPGAGGPGVGGPGARGPAGTAAPRGTTGARGGIGPTLRGLRVCAVGPRAVEVAAVVPGPDRVRAVAARLERTDDGAAHPGRWRVVALCPG